MNEDDDDEEKKRNTFTVSLRNGEEDEEKENKNPFPWYALLFFVIAVAFFCGKSWKVLHTRNKSEMLTEFSHRMREKDSWPIYSFIV